MLVCDAFGTLTQVMSITLRTLAECEIVQLDVGGGFPSLAITATHRVVTEKLQRSCKTVPAGQLQTGDTILCSGGPQVLQQVTTNQQENVDVYEVAFKPDTPVLA